MPTYATLYDAALFTAAGLIFSLVTMWMRHELRTAMLTMVGLMIVGMIGLLVLFKTGEGLPTEMFAVVLREIVLLLLAVGFARIIIIFLFQGALARMAVPRILADVLIALLLVVYVLVRMNAVGVNLASIITTSAVITGVIAFSLQETLGNLWGGIALQLDNTCRIGDWIRIEGGGSLHGQVVSIRWRYLAIATNNNETVMIPNSQLIKNRVTVIGRRGDLRIPMRRTLPFHVGYQWAPSRVIAACETAVGRAEIPNVSRTPAPSCVCLGFDDNGIQYGMRYWIVDLTMDELTDSEVRVHIHAGLARSGMEIPYPHRVLLQGQVATADARREQEVEARQDVLAHLPLFAAFTEDERRALASELVSCPYVTGDVISRQGETSDSLFILAQGTVVIYGAADANGKRPKLATLGSPDYFGEMGVLTGQARTATVIADGEVLCYRLDKLGVDAILQARPALVDALSEVVATRQAANDATLAALSAEARAKQTSGRTADLVRRIRQFFDLG